MNPSETIFDLTKSFFYKGNSVGVMLVHGFTGTPNDLRSFGEYLTQRNISVYGVRLQGHGVHHLALRKTNRFDWFYSLKRAAEKFRSEHNIEKLFLVGFSMGGNLSILFTELVGGLNGIVFINTPIYTKPSRLIFWFIPLIKRFKKFTTKRWVTDMDHYFERRDQGSYYRIPLDSAWQFYKIVQDSKEILEKITVPVYIIQSSRDKSVHPRSADYIFRKIKSTDKKIEYIETDKHHLLINFPKKEEIYEKVYEFIKSHSTP